MSRSRSPVNFERRFSVHDVIDPRWLQLGFAVAFLFSMGLLEAGGSEISFDSILGAATTMCVLVTALTMVLPWRRMPRLLAGLVPALDIATLGLSSLDSAGWAVAPVLVLPVLWLAGTFQRAGALGAGLAGVLFFGLPSTIYLGTDGGTLAWSVLIPVALTALGLAFVEGIDRLDADREELARQHRALLAAAMTISEQRRFADAILDTVDVGLVLLDDHGAARTMNKRHEDFMRQAFPDGVDTSTLFAFHVDATTRLAPEEMPQERAIRGEEFDDCLIWIGEDPKNRRALSVSARPVRDETGVLVGATLAYKDVTEFMRALRVKDEFVASVSHELRTPLTSIRGYVDLVLDQDDVGDDSREFLRVAARNGERLQRLVADLLHTVQTDAGSLRIMREPADLAAVVNDSAETARTTAEAAGLELSCETPDELWAVVDSQRMTQVVDNLVSNAIKYTQTGSVTVKLAVEDRVVIEVSDTGIGIDAMDRDHLFTRFFRAREAQGQSIQGVGLGLSIIKSIVESHGGRIEVESQVGRGSRFQVRLPLDLLRAEVPHPARTAGSTALASPAAESQPH
jgi:signal transduction histidine kinase